MTRTHPEHLDINDLIHVLFLVILVPDEVLRRMVALGALEALGQERFVEAFGLGVSHLLDALQ